MKGRYFVFCMEHYYPSGGVQDLFAVADSREEAERWVEKCKEKYGLAQVLDLETGRVENYEFRYPFRDPLPEPKVKVTDIDEIIAWNREAFERY